MESLVVSVCVLFGSSSEQCAMCAHYFVPPYLATQSLDTWQRTRLQWWKRVCVIAGKEISPWLEYLQLFKYLLLLLFWLSGFSGGKLQFSTPNNVISFDAKCVTENNLDYFNNG